MSMMTPAQMQMHALADIVRLCEQSMANINEIAEEDGVVINLSAKDKARLKKAGDSLRKVRGSALKQMAEVEKA